jgi:hypothetical protein
MRVKKLRLSILYLNKKFYICAGYIPTNSMIKYGTVIN